MLHFKCNIFPKCNTKCNTNLVLYNICYNI
nr:MAG TPA: hypothetical protein [Caudoviricetes sp.]